MTTTNKENKFKREPNATNGLMEPFLHVENVRGKLLNTQHVVI
jgi:hypothetical protein